MTVDIPFNTILLDRLVRWEELPGNSNRKYHAKYWKVVLKGKEGREEGTIKVIQRTEQQPNSPEEQ